MKNISKVLSIILLLTFSVIINQCASNQKTDIKPVFFTEEVPKTINEIYFKDGKVIQCDIVWESVESEICCKKSDDILAYSADEVDLVKTFGETHGKEISERYEERVKHRKLMSSSKIVKPEQEKWMKKKTLERERKRAAEFKAAGITEELIEVEKRRLEDKLKSYKEKYRTASGPPPKGYSGFNEREFYERKIKRVEKKIEELKRDPAMYFYKKSEKPEKPAPIVVPIAPGVGVIVH